MRRVYLDHAATTPIDTAVLDAMLPYLQGKFGNASTIYSWGREAKKALDESRELTASVLNGSPEEIVFTGSGSEAANMALKGAAWHRKSKGNHIITSAIEHHAVLDTVKWLEKNGFEATYVPVNSDGLVDVGQIEDAIRDSTTLISVMHANNEMGTIQPIAEIGALARAKDILFHTDAVQAVGSIEVDVQRLNVDLLSLSAHKFYGPKGVGGLYVRKGVRIEPLVHGGGQERHRRAGTESIASVVGLAKALEIAEEKRDSEAIRITTLRDRLFQGLAAIPNTRVNGSLTKRLPNNVNVCFEFIEGESLLLNLDMKGIAASSGSACTSGSLEPSHVLLAMGLSHEIAHGSLRLTLGRESTSEDVAYVLETVPSIVSRLREMSPLYSK